MKMSNRDSAIKIVTTLRDAGFQALFAGGCVRDMLMGNEPKDYDIATDAHPEAVIKLFRRTLHIGAKFGVVMVLIDSHQFEVATFRTETGYVDGRHPDTVEFASAKEDAARRDFTINGMFYDPIEEKLYDYVDGQADLKNRVIRTIGDPADRFAEDYLRMLRAVRFANRLNFTIDDSTFVAIGKLAGNITNISGERIAVEMESILTHPSRASGVACLIETNLAGAFLPKLSKEDTDLAINVLAKLPDQSGFALALATMFVNCQVQAALEQIEILKLSNEHISRVEFLLANRQRLLDENLSLADLKVLLATNYFDDLCMFQTAIQQAAGKPTDAITDVRARASSLDSKDIAPPPLLNGNELMELGCKPGPAVGRLAKAMYTAQLNLEIKTKDQALQFVERWLAEYGS